jgi:hypothetical protein
MGWTVGSLLCAASPVAKSPLHSLTIKEGPPRACVSRPGARSRSAAGAETSRKSGFVALRTRAAKMRVGRPGDVTAFSADVATARWLLLHGVEVVSGDAIRAADNRDWHGGVLQDTGRPSFWGSDDPFGRVFMDCGTLYHCTGADRRLDSPVRQPLLLGTTVRSRGQALPSSGTVSGYFSNVDLLQRCSWWS